MRGHGLNNDQASEKDNQWQKHLVQRHIGYKPIREVLAYFNDYSAWPNIEDYNRYGKSISNINQQHLKFVEQNVQCLEHYEEKIYKKGLVNTRRNNWHDFFNYTVWQTFPKAKAFINALQYQDYQAQEFSSKRTPRQNYLAHLDESGMFVFSSQPKLLTCLKQHEWKTLFWTHRDEVLQDICFVPFGHAIYEKLLNPYIGLTTKALVFDVPQVFIKRINGGDYQLVDELVYQFMQTTLTNEQSFLLNSKLQPVPILGIPKWSEHANHAKFYDNLRYIRPKPNK